jgi:hypothetical protein
MISETTNRTRKTRNSNLATAIEAPAMVVKPNTPAINATTRNVRAHPNIVDLRENLDVSGDLNV